MTKEERDVILVHYDVASTHHPLLARRLILRLSSAILHSALVFEPDL